MTQRKSTTAEALVLMMSLAISALGAAQVRATNANDHVPLTLTGCVRAGERPGSFLVMDVVIGGEGAEQAATAGAFFRLDGAKGLKEHVGHIVEIRGAADLSDIDRGTLELTRDGTGRTTTAISSERRTVRVAMEPPERGEVPVGTAGTRPVGTTGLADAPIEMYKFRASAVKTYKVKVDSINMVAESCR